MLKKSCKKRLVNLEIYRLPVLFVLIIVFLLPSFIHAEKGKNYVYRTKEGMLLLTDRPQKPEYASLLRVFESRKEKFYTKYGDYYKNKYKSLVAKYSRRNGLNPELVNAVIQVESGYDYTAVSPAGAKGLMQLMDPTAKSLGVTNVFDPEQNIRAGTSYLAKMINKYNGSTKLGLAAYNAGPTAVDRYNGVPPYKETRRYIKKINRILNAENVTVPHTITSKPISNKKKKLTWKRVNGKVVIVEDQSGKK